MITDVKCQAQYLTHSKRATVGVTVIAAVVVGLAPNCTRGRGLRATPGALQPASHPGQPRSDSTLSTHQGASSFLPAEPPPPSASRRSFPSCDSRPAPGPFPRTPPFRPARRGHTLRLPFSCSRCHGSPASTWCWPPYPTTTQTHSVTPSNTAGPS